MAVSSQHVSGQALVPPRGIQCRLLDRADDAMLDALCALEQRAFALDPWPREAFALCFAPHSNQIVLYLTLDRELIGHAVFSLVIDEAELLNISIEPKLRRQGLGRMLLKRVLQEIKDRGGRRCFLEVRESNFQARLLYESCGFNAIYLRKNYYPHSLKGGSEHALVMALELDLE